MKKLILLSFTASVMILSGCQSGGSGNPKEVLSSFFSALAKKDVTTAKKYATKDSDGMLSMMEMGMKMSNNMQNDHEDKMIEMLQNVQMGEPAIKGDEATVPVTDKKSGEVTSFLLKKESGDWKVAFDMATLSNMAAQKMKDHGMDMGNMNMDSINAAMPNMKDKMEQAQKMMDSAKKMMDKNAK